MGERKVSWGCAAAARMISFSRRSNHQTQQRSAVQAAVTERTAWGAEAQLQIAEERSSRSLDCRHYFSSAALVQPRASHLLCGSPKAR